MKTRIFAVLLAFLVLAGIPAFAQTSETGLTLTAQKNFVFRQLSAGLRQDGDTFIYEDFAMVAANFGRENAKINVRLTAPGLDFTYSQDNLGRPLEIIAGQIKRTVMLNVTGAVFPLETGLYFSDVTAEINASAPIYVIPPKIFSTSGFGRTPKEAVEMAWERFGFQVPSIMESGVLVFPYAIYWRNLPAFPNGWDTRIELQNVSGGEPSVLMLYLSDYNHSYDPATWEESQELALASWAFPLGVGESRSMWLREMLGATLNDSWKTEGALTFLFLRGSAQDVSIKVEVIPLLLLGGGSANR